MRRSFWSEARYGESYPKPLGWKVNLHQAKKDLTWQKIWEKIKKELARENLEF